MHCSGKENWAGVDCSGFADIACAGKDKNNRRI